MEALFATEDRELGAIGRDATTGNVLCQDPALPVLPRHDDRDVVGTAVDRHVAGGALFPLIQIEDAFDLRRSSHGSVDRLGVARQARSFEGPAIFAWPSIHPSILRPRRSAAILDGEVVIQRAKSSCRPSWGGVELRGSSCRRLRRAMRTRVDGGSHLAYRFLCLTDSILATAQRECSKHQPYRRACVERNCLMVLSSFEGAFGLCEDPSRLHWECWNVMRRILLALRAGRRPPAAAPCPTAIGATDATFLPPSGSGGPGSPPRGPGSAHLGSGSGCWGLRHRPLRPQGLQLGLRPHARSSAPRKAQKTGATSSWGRSRALPVLSLLFTPSGEESGEWLLDKSKGLAVEGTAVLVTAGVTEALKEGVSASDLTATARRASLPAMLLMPPPSRPLPLVTSTPSRCPTQRG